VAIGELAALIWMPLLLALCDRVRWQRREIIGALGIVFGLLILSNILYALTFIPVMCFYTAVRGRRHLGALSCGVLLGCGMAGAYLFPLMVSQHLFEPAAVRSLHPAAEQGRNLIYLCREDMSQHRFMVLGLIAAAGYLLVIAKQVGWARIPWWVRALMLFLLLLGTTLLIPDFGPRLIHLAHLQVSGYSSFASFSMNILFSALFMVGIALLAYSRIAMKPETGVREHALMALACGAFFFMLPWSAPLWRIAPRTDIVQFPWRLCAILAVCTAALLWRKEDLARELRCTTRQIERLHEYGLGPPRFRIGKRYYYSRESVLAWLKSLEQPRPVSPRRRRQKPAVA
jgi:hypothetical protein